MSVTMNPPVTTVRTTFVCEHDGTTTDVLTDLRDGEKPPEDLAPLLPDGWRLMNDPDINHFPGPLVFHQRTCMSLWLGEFVHRQYAQGDADPAVPTKIRRPRQRKSTPPAEPEVATG